MTRAYRSRPSRAKPTHTRGSAGGAARAGRQSLPPVMLPGTWAAPAPGPLAMALLGTAADALALSLLGTAQRMLELSADLMAPGADVARVRDVSRAIAQAVWRARLEGEACAEVRLLWESVLPRGVRVPETDGHGRVGVGR